MTPGAAPPLSTWRCMIGSTAHATIPRGTTPPTNVPGGWGFSSRFFSLATQEGHSEQALHVLNMNFKR
jgi:hypothetical protein